MLSEAGMKAQPVASLVDLVAQLGSEAGFAVVTEEALVNADTGPLMAWRAAQPEWSDLPFILLTSRGGVERNPAASRYQDLLGNVTFVERPFHPTTLVSLARSALRGRRKQYEARARLEALHQGEERFRAAVDAVEGVLWTNSADGQMLGEQPGWAKLTGQTFDEYQGFGWARAVHPDDVQPTIDAWNLAVAELRPFAFEHRVRCRSGLWGSFSIRAVPAFELDGSLRHWVGVHTDITARREAEAALHDLNRTLEHRIEAALAERNTFADIVETTDVLVQVVNPQLGWVAINRAMSETMEATFGRRAHIGQSPMDFFADWPEQRDEIVMLWRRALTGEAFTIVGRYGDPALLAARYEVTFSPLRNASGGIEGAFFIATNIEQRLRDAERLADTQDALRQSQKMEAIGQLTGGVAHDFNNLLTVIRSSSDLLRRPDLSEEKRVRYLDAIAETSDRAAKLTHQLLAFSRRQPLRPEVFDVAQRLAAITDMLRTVVGSRVRLTIAADPGIFLKADASQFETAIVNLAVNARDAMDGDGALTIRAALLDHDETMVELQMIDTGAGIPSEVLSKLFEPFFTTKEIGRGTGLGLSQVYGFAVQTGGSVRADNADGGGAVFTLALPVTDERPTMRMESASAPTTTGGGRILVVEDNDEIRRFAVQLLADMGYETVDAANADEALQRFEGEALRFDLVFTDVAMPGASGIDLARSIKLRSPAVPIVLTSGFSDALAKADGTEFPLLQKPYSSQQLSKAIETALGR